MKARNACERASALVITLAFVALIALLILGLLETSTLQRASAASHLEGIRAEFFAEDGIDRVVATLRTVTVPSSASTTNYWVSSPGQIVLASSTAGLPDTSVSLSSGLATALSTNTTVAYLSAPNLNVPSFTGTNTLLVTGGEYPIGTSVPMQPKWIYVRQSGTLDTSEIPSTTSTTDPIVGRYAYWTDDESSKINYNLAWSRTATNTADISSPTKVDLSALTNDAPTVNSIHNWITLSTNYATLANGFFNSRDDGQRVSPAVASLLNANYFDITHYNNDPDMTFFNEPRIVLTTQKKFVPVKADGVTPALPFLDILTTENTDPGVYSNIDPSTTATGKLNTTMQMLMRYLQRTDWPMAPGSSFQQKYYSSNPTRLVQLAINIIDYVRCKESALTAVSPLRVQQTTASGTTTYAVTGNNGANDFIGVGRGPLITEAAIWFPATVDSSTNWNTQVVAEIYLPKNYGLASYDLAKLNLLAQIEPPGGGIFGSTNAVITASEVSSGSTTLSAGQYAVVTQPLSFAASGFTYIPRPTSAGLRLSLTPSVGGGKLTVTPQANFNTNAISLIVAPYAAFSIASLPSVELDDPRLGQYGGDWQPCKNGNNTFGSVNSVSTLGTPVSANFYSPEQDADANGNITDASLFMPPPAGTSYNGYNNTNGVVTSVGELGYVDTGVEGFTGAGVPWRTIHLQPSKQAKTVVPDWALMDIFTVPYGPSTNGAPSTNAASIFRPNGTSVGGRINLNAQIAPFTNVLSRITPLTALFVNCGTNSQDLASTMGLSDAQSVAQNISKGPLGGTLASNGKSYGAQNVYFTPGQIVEMQGVADQGEQSEETVRQIASQMTVRGNVFSVYSIGQAIRQTSSGELTITGQRRLEVMIERYIDSASGIVKFRTVQFHNLSQ